MAFSSFSPKPVLVLCFYVLDSYVLYYYIIILLYYIYIILGIILFFLNLNLSEMDHFNLLPTPQHGGKTGDELAPCSLHRWTTPRYRTYSVS